MSFFNPEVPIFVRKKSAFDIPDMPGLWRIHWQIQDFVVLSSFYTRHDQACLLWGAIAASIFCMAQFLPVSWALQTAIACGLTLLGITVMMALTWRFIVLERLNWVLGLWALLMLVGALGTCLGVFAGWGQILINICPLWLGLSAIGYLATGLRMRSRMFLLISLLHLVAIGLLPYIPAWKPLITGIVISVSAFLIAEFQWDAHGVCGYQTQLSTDPGTAEGNWEWVIGDR